MNPLGTSPANASDPYWNSSLNPFFNLDEYTAMTNGMNAYASGQFGSPTYSIWEMAYIIANCPMGGGNFIGCASCSMPNGHTFNDDEWNIYKMLYIGMKQKLQQQHAVQFAIAEGCYNGCIGEEPFNPFANNFFHTTYTDQTTWTGAPWNFGFFRSQYFNLEQPCN